MRKDWLKEVRHCGKIPCDFKVQMQHYHWYHGKWNNRNIIKGPGIWDSCKMMVIMKVRDLGNRHMFISGTNDSIKGEFIQCARDGRTRVVGIINKNLKAVFFSAKDYGPWEIIE